MNHQILEYSSTIVIYIGYNNLKLVHLEPKGYTDTIRGRFLHDHLIGKKYGTKIWSQNEKGFAYAIRPDPHLFSLSLDHKTQILFQADISMVLHLLNLSHGDTVFESGTGSCSLTFSLSKRVGSTGRVFTFEFNNGRYKNACEVVRQMKLGNVQCYWQNVLENGFSPKSLKEDTEDTQNQENKDVSGVTPLPETEIEEFGEIADAVFLDLPSPELVVPHATKVLKRGGRLCSFSPCIEQIQVTAKAMVNLNYTQLRTVEIIEREMKSKFVGNKRISPDSIKEDNGDDLGLFVDQNDQKMHTGYLIFATRL
jgi:tRNA (adenine57-N1/adenine58-N1)-methyltransferase